MHLVVPRDRIHSGPGLILRTASSMLFVIPWDAARLGAPEVVPLAGLPG